jgi:hypothetical protein
MGMIGSVVRPQRFKCGGAWFGCDHDHDWLAPADVLIVSNAITYEDMRAIEGYSQENEDKARNERLAYFGDKGLVPTLLGIWYENCSAN